MTDQEAAKIELEQGSAGESVQTSPVVTGEEVPAQAEPVQAEVVQEEQASSDQVPKRVLSDAQKVALLEALLLANGEPLSVARIQEVVECPKGEVLELADKLQSQLQSDVRGIELVVVAEKLQLRTKADYADYVRQLMAVRPKRLSQAALETLAVVAYQQPVVKSEIDKIRGVDVSPTLKTLLERKLVKILGYQASVGQPALYGTTEEFLQVFGLASLSSLPSIQDLKALLKEPGEAQQSAEDDVDESPAEQPFSDETHVVSVAAEGN